ncbi:HAD family hydrolase [Nakamurella alba]|uniref:HAD family hydrolase n=1 Tax=Nakamurella alba TaxID=2665158 RepID=UPI002AC32F09|nr:HAD family hydrolase [Nakamurella alba]
MDIPGGLRQPGQTLIFDADDTLWENNKLFEQVIADFIGWLDHPTLDRDAIRAILDDIERADTAVHGYGSAVFLQSLAACFRTLRERPASSEEIAHIEELAVALLEHRIELMPGVADTLTLLGGRHHLMMLTKGAQAEQQAKIDVSGLAPHFRSVHIVREKDEHTYRSLLGERSLDPATTWMIGNSPRSDILPARAVGMRAVHLPNVHTWVLDHADLDPADTGILTLTRFTDLADHF